MEVMEKPNTHFVMILYSYSVIRVIQPIAM